MLLNKLFPYRNLAFFALFSFLVAMLLSTMSKPIVFVDDAWITFRYAYNLAYHGQLNFNLNENVEGITNALWAVLLAFQMRMFTGSVINLTLVNSLFFSLLTLYRIWQIGKSLNIPPMVAVIPSLFLILTPDYFEALTIGLEVPLFSWLMIEALYWFVKRKFYLSSFCFGLLFLTRPEASVLGGIFFAVLLNPAVVLENHLSLIIRVFRFETKFQFLEFLKILSVFLVILAFATTIRIVFYHDILPNSMHAKYVSFNENLFKAGVSYVKEFNNSNVHFLIVFLASLLVISFVVVRNSFQNRFQDDFIQRETTIVKILFFSILALIFSFIVVIRNGGDWMPAYRLLSQYGVLYSILLSSLIGIAGKFRKVVVVSALILLLYPLSITAGMVVERVKTGTSLIEVYQTPDFPFWDDTAARLSLAPLTSSDIVSAEGIGYISYNLPGIYMHDPLGLTEKHIAKYGNDSSPFGKKDIRYTVTKIRPSVMIWQYVGHLRAIDSETLDENYVTYCHDYCYSWHDADIVMIRKDRVPEIAAYFNDWEQITIKELFERE